MNSRDVIEALEKGRVTVPHPQRNIPIGTLKSIENRPGSS
jgi:predicted RNA binding protein YcfA (HicA-like mRNA interferase family)